MGNILFYSNYLKANILKRLLTKAATFKYDFNHAINGAKDLTGLFIHL